MLNARQLKLIACVSMIFSHTGVIFWPSQVWWQIPGRIAMPIFAFMIANGARMSRNVWQYLTRLLVFAALIQYPYSVFLANGRLNICFTLGLGLAAIIAWQSSLPVIARLTMVLAACLTAEWLNAEYGWYGIMMIFFSHIFFTERRMLAIGWVALNAVLLWQMTSDLLAGDTYPQVQGLCLLALPLVLLYDGKRGGGWRWEFYAFYIGHLALLYALRRALWGF
ncbi:MAG: conjugal transfer protein TraX [Clostridiales bacterium]|nr:conjugal transfer protein TraX [Clostridiales bacterium]